MANGTPCVVDDCGLPGINLSGLCGKHYGKFIKDGHPKVEEARKASKALPKTPEQVLREKERNRRHQRRARLAGYGLTPEGFDSMWELQGGLCAICKREMTLVGPLRCNIDHDHVTGAVRGLLCRPCNSGLGFFADVPERLASAITYLRATA